MGVGHDVSPSPESTYKDFFICRVGYIEGACAMDDLYHFYRPEEGHGLAHDPLNAIIGPRPLGWVSTVSADGDVNLAPYSFFNAFNYRPPIIGFSSTGAKDSLRNAEATGEFVWGDRSAPDVYIVPLTVVETRPPEFFSFRWGYPAGEIADVDNSLLVTFELTASGAGTAVRMVELGFREIGWEVAVLEKSYKEHVEGWDRHLPDLVAYVAKLVARR